MHKPPGKNKHGKLLLGTVYRSDLPEKFENILTHLATTWGGLIGAGI